MTDFSNESVIALVAALVALALIGWLLMRGASRGTAKAVDADQPPALVPEAVPLAPAPADNRPRAAIGIPAAEGPPDNLNRIKGIGPKLGALLTSLEIMRYDQIAAWGPTEIATVDAHLGTFKGRIARDNWVEQAGLLADGRIAEFEGKFGKLDSNLA